MREREREGVRILDLDGKLVSGDDTGRLRDWFHDAAEAGVSMAVLNLKGVPYIDSSGLGALVIGYTTMKKAGGGLKLLNLTRRSIELLVLTKLETLFEVFNDEQDAINSFFPDRELRKFDILSFVQQNQKH